MTISPRPTPNPDSLKFEIDDGRVIESGLLAFHSAREAGEHPLGRDLFAIRGVETLLIVPAFVTVTKHPAADWDQLVEGIEHVLRQHVVE